MNRPSIRRHLLLLIIPAIFGIWLFATIISFFDTHYEVEKLMDARLAQVGRVLLAISSHELLEQRLLGSESQPTTEVVDQEKWQLGHPYEKKIAFQVWLNKTTLALRSDNAPTIPITSKIEGFSSVERDDIEWRAFSLQTNDGLISIHVAEQNDIRHNLANAVVWRTLVPVFFALPFIGIIIWYAISRGMNQLKRIAFDLGERRHSNFTPIAETHIPEEVKPITEALNKIFEQIKTAFDMERRFTSDAAHELRTPLAALKTHAEIALAASNDNERRQALRQIVRGVDRATRLVEQLLTLARLDPDTGLANTKRFDLFIVAERVISDEAPIAIEKNIEISLNGTRGKFVYCNADAIAVLMRNLIDNAIRYTPENGEVSITILRNDEYITLRVSDSGPGIPPDQREKIFQRFYRLLGTKTPGSGLGLSIVSRIVELYKLKIELGDADIGGLQIDVVFKAMDTALTATSNGTSATPPA